MITNKREEILTKAKPILFNTEIVRAIMDGRKTQTRRLVKPQPESRLAYTCMGYGCGKWGYPDKNVWKYWEDESFRIPENLTQEELSKNWTPPCHTDDILYVRETFCKEDDKYYYRADFDNDYLDPCETLTGGYPSSCRYRNCDSCSIPAQRIIWHPSIHMPKEAARIFLRVTNVSVAKLQDITGEDIVKEGMDREPLDEIGEDFFKGMFHDLWDSTIKKADLTKYGWDANPWVWVIELERID